MNINRNNKRYLWGTIVLTMVLLAFICPVKFVLAEEVSADSVSEAVSQAPSAETPTDSSSSSSENSSPADSSSNEPASGETISGGEDNSSVPAIITNESESVAVVSNAETADSDEVSADDVEEGESEENSTESAEEDQAGEENDSNGTNEEVEPIENDTGTSEITESDEASQDNEENIGDDQEEQSEENSPESTDSDDGLLTTGGGGYVETNASSTTEGLDQATTTEVISGQTEENPGLAEENQADNKGNNGDNQPPAEIISVDKAVDKAIDTDTDIAISDELNGDSESIEEPEVLENSLADMAISDELYGDSEDDETEIDQGDGSDDSENDNDDQESYASETVFSEEISFNSDNDQDDSNPESTDLNKLSDSEGSFVTSDEETLPSAEVSIFNNESSFVTADDQPNNQGLDLSISDELSFMSDTTDIEPNLSDIALSDEQYFLTDNDLSPPIDEPAVSDEYDFTTEGDTPPPPPIDQPTISDEYNFTTDGDTPPIDEPAVSDEYDFTTEGDTPPPPPPSGGGGGGGSSYYRPVEVLTQRYCSVYLLKFIRYGWDNDPVEVRKLQAFLIVFEGETQLRVTGFYDLATYRAVERFQMKYLRDVLSPWGINYPTGYVYITTRLAINNVFCGRDTANDLDLRQRISQVRSLLDQPVTEPLDLVKTKSSTSTDEQLTVVKISKISYPTQSWWQKLYLALFACWYCWPCWWWILSLLLVILILLLVIWYLLEKNDRLKKGRDGLSGNVIDTLPPVVLSDGQEEAANDWYKEWTGLADENKPPVGAVGLDDVLASDQSKETIFYPAMVGDDWESSTEDKQSSDILDESVGDEITTGASAKPMAELTKELGELLAQQEELKQTGDVPEEKTEHSV